MTACLGDSQQLMCSLCYKAIQHTGTQVQSTATTCHPLPNMVSNTDPLLQLTTPIPLSTASAAHLRHDNQQRSLPYQAALAAHVGPRHDGSPLARPAQLQVVGHCSTCQLRVQHGVAAPLDGQLGGLVILDKGRPAGQGVVGAAGLGHRAVHASLGGCCKGRVFQCAADSPSAHLPCAKKGHTS